MFIVRIKNDYLKRKKIEVRVDCILRRVQGNKRKGIVLEVVTSQRFYSIYFLFCPTNILTK